MRRLPTALITSLALLIVGCAPDRSVDTARSTGESGPAATEAASASPSATESPSPTASPTPQPEALAPEIVDFTQVGGSLNVRIHNPNENLGLARVGFELTAIAADGSIIEVFGSQTAVPGAPFGTIYQFPPGGDYGMDLPMNPDGPAVAELELVITDEWIEWDSVEAPEVELTNVSLIPQEFGGFHVTGRAGVARAEEGPFNVWVMAFVNSGSGLLVASGSIDCVQTTDARAFDIQSFAFETQGPYELDTVIAYTTTIPGTTEDPPNNC